MKEEKNPRGEGLQKSVCVDNEPSSHQFTEHLHPNPEPRATTHFTPAHDPLPLRGTGVHGGRWSPTVGGACRAAPIWSYLNTTRLCVKATRTKLV